jgi:hypothetical protein
VYPGPASNGHSGHAPQKAAPLPQAMPTPAEMPVSVVPVPTMRHGDELSMSDERMDPPGGAGDEAHTPVESPAKRPVDKSDKTDPPGPPRSNGKAKNHTPRTLEITFRPSGELERDKFRLKEMVERVRDPKGRDLFQIVVQANGRKTRLAFPGELCTINSRLTSELEKHFRVDVRIAE